MLQYWSISKDMLVKQAEIFPINVHVTLMYDILLQESNKAFIILKCTYTSVFADSTFN